MKILPTLIALVLFFCVASSSSYIFAFPSEGPTIYYSYDSNCRFGTHKAVTFDQGACASWTPGTSQRNLCSQSEDSGNFCFQLSNYNGSSPSTDCNRQNELGSEPVPCGTCLPEKTNPGKFFKVTNCQPGNGQQMTLHHGCSDSTCGNCEATQTLNEKSCQLLGTQTPILVYVGEAVPCGRNVVTIQHFASNENCNGQPDKTETLYTGFCYSPEGAGTGSSFSCEHFDHQQQQEQKSVPLKELKSKSSSSAQEFQGNTEVWQCGSAYCEQCHRVATYYKDACISFVASSTNPQAQSFTCQPLNSTTSSPSMCINVLQYQTPSTVPNTANCSQSADILAGFTQQCDKCYSSGPSSGEYYRYENCLNDPSNFGLRYGCKTSDCNPANCGGFVQIPLNTCRINANGASANLYRHPTACDSETVIEVWNGNRRCGGAGSQIVPIPAGPGTCSTGSAKGANAIGQEYVCV